MAPCRFVERGFERDPKTTTGNLTRTLAYLSRAPFPQRRPRRRRAASRYHRTATAPAADRRAGFPPGRQTKTAGPEKRVITHSSHGGGGGRFPPHGTRRARARPLRYDFLSLARLRVVAGNIKRWRSLKRLRDNAPPDGPGGGAGRRCSGGGVNFAYQ